MGSCATARATSSERSVINKSSSRSRGAMASANSSVSRSEVRSRRRKRWRAIPNRYVLRLPRSPSNAAPCRRARKHSWVTSSLWTQSRTTATQIETPPSGACDRSQERRPRSRYGLLELVLPQFAGHPKMCPHIALPPQRKKIRRITILFVNEPSIAFLLNPRDTLGSF
jgi:hypothetical protein